MSLPLELTKMTWGLKKRGRSVYCDIFYRIRYSTTQLGNWRPLGSRLFNFQSARPASGRPLVLPFKPCSPPKGSYA